MQQGETSSSEDEFLGELVCPQDVLPQQWGQHSEQGESLNSSAAAILSRLVMAQDTPLNRPEEECFSLSLTKPQESAADILQALSDSFQSPEEKRIGLFLTKPQESAEDILESREEEPIDLSSTKPPEPTEDILEALFNKEWKKSLRQGEFFERVVLSPIEELLEDLLPGGENSEQAEYTAAAPILQQQVLPQNKPPQRFGQGEPAGAASNLPQNIPSQGCQQSGPSGAASILPQQVQPQNILPQRGEYSEQGKSSDTSQIPPRAGTAPKTFLELLCDAAYWIESSSQGGSLKISQLSSEQVLLQEPPLRALGDKKSRRRNLRSRRGKSLFENPYQKTYDLQNVFRGKTLYGYVQSELHYSVWDPNCLESPARGRAINEAIEGLGSRVAKITEQEMVDISDIELLTLAHNVEHINLVRSLCENQKQTDAQLYESIYYNGKHSYESAIRAARMTVSMAKLIATEKYQNGFANVRPHGHRATDAHPRGYCFFNNVAITAQYLLNQKLADRVLIFDLDIRHGQGTQRFFYESDKVLYFSIHRFQHGMSFPNSKEGNFHYVGDKGGEGYNVNVPLNETGLNDYDYLSIVINILLPMAYEFKPSFILISAGYGATLGCPEGQMKVTPAFYSHLIHLLGGLAHGKILAVLEGGYFLPSLAEGALQTVKALLNDPAQPLDYHREINGSVIDSINDVKVAHRPYWKCLEQVEPVTHVPDVLNYDKYNNHVAIVKYFGDKTKPPFSSNSYPKNTECADEMFKSILLNHKERYFNRQTSVGIVKNNISELHDTIDSSALEKEDRVIIIDNKLKDFSLYKYLKKLSLGDLSEPEAEDERPLYEDVREMISLTHSAEYLEKLEVEGPPKTPDTYWTEHSYMVCQHSCANLFNLVSQIRSGLITHGVAVVRPPGHHACCDAGHGFCLINNAVVTANVAIKKYGYKIVIILDFDVHHGDGTQKLTYLKNNIMYISVHRHEGGNFFPYDPQGNFMHIGRETAAGFNLNVPFEKGKMGNADYLATWLKVVVPLVYALNPDLILISAGFDAAVNDPLGDYSVHPEVFGQMVQTVKSIAPTIVILEGGYNRESVSSSMVNCCRALLGHPIPMPTLGNLTSYTAPTIHNSITAIKPYWPIMETNKKLNSKIIRQENLEC